MTAEKQLPKQSKERRVEKRAASSIFITALTNSFLPFS